MYAFVLGGEMCPRWGWKLLLFELLLAWAYLILKGRRDVTFTKFHGTSLKDACHKFTFLECCGDPSGLPTRPVWLAPEFAAKPTLLLVVPVVWVKEAVLFTPSLLSLTACRRSSCSSSKESVVEGQEWEARSRGKAGWHFWHWCQHTWLEVFIRVALSIEIPLSFLQAEMLV